MVAERVERGLGHGVHRVGADQLFDVHHVAVGRVLRARRRPQRLLHARARRRELLPAVAGEDVEEPLVRLLRVRDRDLAAQRRALRELLVHGGIDTRDEERRNGGGEVGAAVGQSPLQPRDVRASNLLVPLDAEQQRDVDVDAFGGKRFDGGDTLCRPRDLDHHVRAIDAREQLLCLRDRRFGVVRDRRFQLE